MEIFNSIFTGINDLYTKQRELEAIWLERSFNSPFGRTYRVTNGTMIKIEGGKLVDFTGEPSHKVIACFGTLVNQFEITVLDLNTNEPSQIKL